jgi:hypothetical protein
MFAPVLPPCDASSLTDDELVGLFREMEVQRRRREVMVASVVGEVERRGLHLDDGHLSVQAWCRATGRWSPAEARAVHRVARLLRAWPQIVEAGLGRERRARRAPARDARAQERTPAVGPELGGVLSILLGEVGRLEFVDFRTVGAAVGVARGRGWSAS